MNLLQFIAQIIGILGIIVFLLCYHFKNMKSILKVKLLVDVIWGTHYFMLGAYSGFATNSICCIRELIFMNNAKKLFRSKIWLLVFIMLNIGTALLTWQGYFSIIPALASSMATFSFWQKDVRIARKIAITNNVLMFIYDIFVSSYAGMIGESLSFVSVLIAIYSNRKRFVTKLTKLCGQSGILKNPKKDFF